MTGRPDVLRRFFSSSAKLWKLVSRGIVVGLDRYCLWKERLCILSIKAGAILSFCF